MITLALLLAAAPEPITFDQAIARALSSHPALRAADAEVARAEAQVVQARAPSLPQLGANVAYTRLDADRVSNGAVIAGADQLNVNLQLQVPLVAPQRWASWRRSEANADAVEVGARDVRRQLALSVARTWLTVLAQQRIVQAQQRGVEVSDAHVAYAQSRLEGGIGNRLDALRANQERAVARTQLATAQGQLERLQEVLGAAIGADVALDAAADEPPLAALPAPQAAEDGAATARTDVRAAEARLQAAVRGAEWAWSDYLPLLLATAQPAYQNPPTLTLPEWSFQAQLVLSLPIFEGLLRVGQQAEREAIASAAEAQLESTVRAAKAEVRAALSQVGRADEALAAARDAARDADATLEVAEQAFRAGGTTNLEVIDAERRARDAATTVALAENAARQIRLEALAAAGLFPAAAE